MLVSSLGFLKWICLPLSIQGFGKPYTIAARQKVPTSAPRARACGLICRCHYPAAQQCISFGVLFFIFIFGQTF